jgi:hypothetical protein
LRFDHNGRAIEEEDTLKANPFDEHKHLLTDPVFLIGNGKSREHFDLERLRDKGTIIGCNALYRDFEPDVLLAIDAKLLKEIRSADYDLNHFCIIPHNRSISLRNAKRWRTERYNTTGCFAIMMIDKIMKPTFCYMLGMDGYPGNMYDATINYAQDTLQNFSGVNSYYLKALNQCKNTMFVNVNEKDSWDKNCRASGYYSAMSYQEFEDEIMA